MHNYYYYPAYMDKYFIETDYSLFYYYTRMRLLFNSDGYFGEIKFYHL